VSEPGTLPPPPPAATAARINAENAQTLPRAAPGVCTTCPEDLVRIGIFFDGTGNNMSKDIGTQSTTNVAKLWTIYKHDESKLARAYYHGVGSEGGLDAFFGGAFGAGGKFRIARHIEIVSEFFTRDTNGVAPDKIIDVYGFSRGAALARDFINEVRNRGVPDKTQPPEGWLWEDRGPDMPQERVPVYPRIRGIRAGVMGLFDTVSSFAAGDAGFDFTVDHSYVHKVIHLIAEDEVRSHFSVQSIRGEDAEGPEPLPNEGTRMIELALPGAHSDVGGGYAPGYQGRDQELAHIALKIMHTESTGNTGDAPMLGLDAIPWPHAIPGDLQALHDTYMGERPEPTKTRYLHTFPTAEYDKHVAARQKLASWIALRAKYIHKQEVGWSPGSWGNRQSNQRRVFYDAARGTRGAK
jgi:hypothetical protein